MIRKFCLFVLLFIECEVFVSGKVIKYPLSAIPDNLKANAKMVIRNYEEVFEIKSVGRATATVT